MGCRDMYYKLSAGGKLGIGRDKFEAYCRDEGLMSKRTRNKRKTTDSKGVTRFDNLIENLKITRPNQVWQSDITYYDIGCETYYLTFIIDCYSRMIVGSSVSKRLLTEATTLPCLQQALRLRKGLKLNGLILHSDGGGQYYDKDFLALVRKYKIRTSMCCHPWKNPYAERINGTIKNNYLRHKFIKTFADLERETTRSVNLYNSEKPHIGLKRNTPEQVEKRYYAEKQVATADKQL